MGRLTTSGCGVALALAGTNGTISGTISPEGGQMPGQFAGHLPGQTGQTGQKPQALTGQDRGPPFRGGPNVPASGGATGHVPPLDTPADWHDSIARRAAEWRDLGPEAAIRAWNARGECSRAVLDVALADLAARRAGEAIRRG